MKRTLYILASLIGFVFLYGSCSKILPKLLKDDEILDGPIEGLTSEQSRIFLKGDVAFNDEIFNQQNGLGPLFVANSCGTCHAGDGKGHPFTTLTRFGQSDTLGNKFLHAGVQQPSTRQLLAFNPNRFLQVLLSPASRRLPTLAWGFEAITRCHFTFHCR
jgi:hypothetical protein